MTQADVSNKRSFLPNIGDIVFVLLMYLMLFLRPDLLFADGSTGWHLVSGKYVIEQHAIPRFDLISYTFPHSPWIAYEWLSDTIMACLLKLGGLNLLAVATSAIIAMLFLFIYKRCRGEGGSFLLVTIIITLGAIASSIHWLVRPHIWTLLGVYLFYTKLEDFYRGTIGSAYLITLPVFMLLWVNCHPGFLFGIVILGIYLTIVSIQYICTASSPIKQKYLYQLKVIGTCLLSTFIATLANPNFAALYSYIIKYLHRSAVLMATQEFASPIFHGEIQPLCLEILFGLFAIGLTITKKHITFPSLMMSLVFAYLSLLSQRNMPLFVIVILPVIARLFSETVFSSGDTNAGYFNSLANWLQGILRNSAVLNSEFTVIEARCNVHILPIVFVLFLSFTAICGGSLLGIKILDVGFDKRTAPTQTLNYIQEQKLNPSQGLNFDNWGGYIRYKIGIPVFIDDRADFYPESFYLSYGTVAQTLPGWQAVLKQYGIKWIIFPNNSRLVAALSERPEWRLAAKDDAASLYIQNP